MNEIRKYSDVFEPLPEAYQTLLLDVLRGDQTLFVHADEVLQSWELYDPLLARKLPVHLYAAGGAGPEQAGPLAIPEQWLFDE